MESACNCLCSLSTRQIFLLAYLWQIQQRYPILRCHIGIYLTHTHTHTHPSITTSQKRIMTQQVFGRLIPLLIFPVFYRNGYKLDKFYLIFKNLRAGVSIVVQGLMSPTSIHEDLGSIPGLSQ